MNDLTPSYSQFQTYQPSRDDITEDVFYSLLPDAEALVDELIFPNVVDSSTSENALEAYQKAICAIVCVDNDYPGGVAKSYTSGKVREDYDAASIPTHENTARKYLSGSGLLCRWL